MSQSSQAKEPASQAAVRLDVSGEFIRGKHLLFFQSTPRPICNAPFCYCLELLRAAYDSEAGFLYILDTIFTDGDPIRTRQLVRRLKLQLHRKSIVVNNEHGGYRLNVNPEFIRLRPSLWELPPEVVDPNILNALRRAYDAFHAR
jgi:hypothetical protein